MPSDTHGILGARSQNPRCPVVRAKSKVPGKARTESQVPPLMRGILGSLANSSVNLSWQRAILSDRSEAGRRHCEDRRFTQAEPLQRAGPRHLLAESCELLAHLEFAMRPSTRSVRVSGGLGPVGCEQTRPPFADKKKERPTNPSKTQVEPKSEGVLQLSNFFYSQ